MGQNVNALENSMGIGLEIFKYVPQQDKSMAPLLEYLPHLRICSVCVLTELL